MEVVRRFTGTRSRNDQLELLAEDVIIKNPRGLFDVPGIHHGHEGWREFAAAFEEVFDNLVPDIKEFVDAGEWVLWVVRYTGRARASGVMVEANQVDAARVLDGKIVEMNLSHRSKEAALKAVGLSEHDAHAGS